MGTTTLSARQLSQLISSKSISPVEVMEACLEKIAAEDSVHRAFLSVYYEDARRAAYAADQAIRNGGVLSPLHGLPISVKDLIEVEGQLTTGGSAIWSSRRSRKTAFVVRQLEELGVIVVGKNSLVEFGLGAWGTNEQFGTPRNPYSSSHTYLPGGSSSGSAVAVRAQLVPWALGTDTGGSLRIPASWCGIVGIKPSDNRVSKEGVIPLSPTLDSVGPLARDVQDAALLLDAVQQPGTKFSTGFLNRLSSEDSLKKAVRGVKLGYLDTRELADVCADVLDSYENSISALSRLGATVVRQRLPRPIQEYRLRTSAITLREACQLYGAYAKQQSNGLGEGVRSRLIEAESITPEQYSKELIDRRNLIDEFDCHMSDIDVLLTPSTRTAALRPDAAKHLDPPNYFTRFVNYLALCAVSIPNGQTAERLPTSLQIIGKAGGDELAITIARAAEMVVTGY